jgi:hypothetical protein
MQRDKWQGAREGLLFSLMPLPAAARHDRTSARHDRTSVRPRRDLGPNV